MRRHRLLPYCPSRPQAPHLRAVLATAFNLLIARRLADPTRPAPGPDTPTPIPV